MAERDPEKLCRYTYEDGRGCGAYRIGGSDYCLTHSRTPEERSRAASWAAKGKAEYTLPLDFEHVEWLLGLLIGVLNVSWNRRHVVELLASLCNASDGQRERIEEQLANLAPFERLLLEREWIDREELHEDLQRLATRTQSVAGGT